MRFILVLRVTFELQQEVCSHASGSVELLFMLADLNKKPKLNLFII